ELSRRIRKLHVRRDRLLSGPVPRSAAHVRERAVSVRAVPDHRHSHLLAAGARAGAPRRSYAVAQRDGLAAHAIGGSPAAVGIIRITAVAIATAVTILFGVALVVLFLTAPNWVGN